MRDCQDQRLRRLGRAACSLFVALSMLIVCKAGRAETEQEPSPAKATSHPLDAAIRLAKTSRDSLNDVNDYVATFHKKERIGNRIISHTMKIKHRRDPFSVYLKFIGEHDGREVIYVDGRNSGKLLVHETGLASIVGTISLLPGSPEAMSESIHPLTDIGMWNLVDKVIAQWEAEKKLDDIEIKYYPNAKLGTKTECKVIETTHTKRNRSVRHFRTRLYIDKSTSHPVRVEQFGFPAKSGDKPPMIGEYQYTDIRVNQSLADLDFDTKNPSYGY